MYTLQHMHKACGMSGRACKCQIDKFNKHKFMVF